MKIAIFYHLCQINNWQSIFNDQFLRLSNSGLLSQADYVHIGISGNQELPIKLPGSVIIKRNSRLDIEQTLEDVWVFSKNNPEFYILYFHSKGVTHSDDTNVTSWRKYLEYFTIDNWKACVDALQYNDCAGAEWKLYQIVRNQCGYAPHFAGNFWWATANYISKLDIDFLYNAGITNHVRLNGELWIGTQNPKVKCFHKNALVETLYDIDYTEDYYRLSQPIMENNMQTKKTKIAMMSMFQNEATTIRRMLESCYKYIDYYVLQDNGSTDGTPDIVADFFKDKNIPGFVYKVEEGWVGFGWNRDHVLQKLLASDHGCDWILKMDCDETLKVDDTFDWSVFDDTSIQSFHVPALSGGCFYFRAWMYNAKLPWRFNHDTAHETITLDIDNIGESFQRVPLPIAFRHETFTDGQSYGVRTKYLTDALKLEEKLIREESMLTDTYHFWYVGKSYYDCCFGDFYPLKNSHSQEFARRSIFYFREFINFVHNYDTVGYATRIDEMSYYAMMLIGNLYNFLGDTESSIKYLTAAEGFAPERNEHLVKLSETYNRIGEFEKMHEVTSRLILPERKNPFPNYHFMIEAYAYHDTSTHVYDLHAIAINNLKPSIEIQPTPEIKSNLKVNLNMKKRMFIIDDFYENPDDVRNFALSLEYQSDIRWYKGQRSKLTFKPGGLKEMFESIIGEKIVTFDEHSFNGCFQITTAEDPQVYHHDVQKWAGMIYLTPNAPHQSGTRLHRSTISGARHADEPAIANAFDGGFIDSTKFDTIDNAGNVYNRLVLMDAKCIHSAGPYFGNSNESGRLIHLFFFD